MRNTRTPAKNRFEKIARGPYFNNKLLYTAKKNLKLVPKSMVK